MDRSQRPFAPAKPWQALLAPLPDDAHVRRQPVGSPEVLAMPEGQRHGCQRAPTGTDQQRACHSNDFEVQTMDNKLQEKEL